MVVNKTRKCRRYRGYTTHGCGSMKKRRGAGNRGGRGHSGSGKRGDQQKPRFWKDKHYFGKYGFTSKSRMPDMNVINIKTLEDRADLLVKQGLAKAENGSYIINLADLGYNKLLSTGNATKKLMITTEYATPNALDKVKKAGGDVIVTAKPAPVKKKKPAGSPKQKEAEEAA